MQRGDGWRVRETPAFRDRGMEGERDTCREGEGWRVRDTCRGREGWRMRETHVGRERGMEGERHIWGRDGG